MYFDTMGKNYQACYLVDTYPSIHVNMEGLQSAKTLENTFGVQMSCSRCLVAGVDIVASVSQQSDRRYWLAKTTLMEVNVF